jgi:hypothetical protein
MGKTRALTCKVGIWLDAKALAAVPRSGMVQTAHD